MFLCTQEARVQYPVSLLPSGAACYGVVFKELTSSWFIVTFDTRSGGETISQTALIADVERLSEILQSDEIAMIHSVNCMANDGTTRGWVYRDIDEIWLEKSSGRFIIHDADDNYASVTILGLEAIKSGRPRVNWILLFGTKDQDE